jgi:hypothetical protein
MVKLNTSFIRLALPDLIHGRLVPEEGEGAFLLMDYIDKVLERLKEWARKLVEALLGPEVQPEPEPIPVPVREPQRRR